jgi:hypothetical protein
MPGRTENETASFRLRHLRLGWISLFVFIALGAVLESMHGFKVDWYLAVGNETRRLMWRLAHAHGTFLALVHIGFALTLSDATRRSPRLASACLTGAIVALPLGFWLGGFGVRGGDPGVGILLVPLGAVLLLLGVGAVIASLGRSGSADSDAAG